MIKNKKLNPMGFALLELSEYREARALAAKIGDREERQQDIVFSDAMNVAAVLALEDQNLPHTRPNLAWMFERICPSEVLAVLRLRLSQPGEYSELPMAHTTDRMTPHELNAATTLANTLTRKEVDAFFFSDKTGRA